VQRNFIERHDEQTSQPEKTGHSRRAKRAFLAHGYSGASMEAIAEAAPVSKPTLYSHFKGKQELFAAMIAGECESLLDTLSRVHTEQLDPIAGLKAIASAFVDLVYADEALQLYRLLIAEQQHFPELGELVYRSGPEPVLQLLSSYLSKLDGVALCASRSRYSSRLLVGC